MKKYFTDEAEVQKRKDLTVLMNDWKKVIKSKGKIEFFDDGKKYDAIDYFNSDGFFPGYFSAKQRVLFIGRESRYSSGSDRITSDLDSFSELDANSSSYWRRILYLTYGIKRGGKVKFADLPSAQEILSEMRKSNNYGFAIMNISKYSNDRDDGAVADYSLIDRFLEDSELDKRNFVQEEIALLEPHVIITANLWNEGGIREDLLNLAFPEDKFSDMRAVSDKACFYHFRLGRRTVKLIDLYHFSSRKSDEDYFYKPVMKLLFP